MAVAEIAALRARLRELRRALLPKKFSPTGSYSDAQYDMVRAYRLLAHAELEAFLEAEVERILAAVSIMWTTNLKLRKIALNLALQAASAENRAEVLRGVCYTTKGVRTKATTFLTAATLAGAVQAHSNAVKSNHGIREKNLRKILLPIGVSVDDIDNASLVALDSFGQSRGQTAHTSAKVQQQPDPRSELTTVNHVLSIAASLSKKMRRMA